MTEQWEQCPDCKGDWRIVGHEDHYDDPIEPSKYVVTFECVTFQDIDAVRNLMSNAIAFMQENFVETTGKVEQVK